MAASANTQQDEIIAHQYRSVSIRRGCMLSIISINVTSNYLISKNCQV